MFTYKSISALVIVILCCSQSCLNKQDIDPNSSLLAAANIENGPSHFHQHHIDSVEKSDHNFYLPINDKSNKSVPTQSTKDTSSNLPLTRKLSKKSFTCEFDSQRLFLALISSSKHRTFDKPHLQQNLIASTVPNENLNASCEKPPSFFQQNNDTKHDETILSEKGFCTCHILTLFICNTSQSSFQMK